MAEIDKIYTSSYEDYKAFKDWAKTQTIVFFDGYKVCVGDWVRDYDDESEFGNGAIPIMNTPTWLDIYLIQNCKIQFVIDRMKEVYRKSTYEYFMEVDLTATPPAEFKQNRKIVIKRNEYSRFPLHSKPYGGARWWLQSENNFWYNEETKTWVNDEVYYPKDTNTAHITSIKALVRHLRKQYLPKGIKFTISGVYVGEIYSVYIR